MGKYRVTRRKNEFMLRAGFEHPTTVCPATTSSVGEENKEER
jgi:hypothetical protein